jgi:hypothetical protein
LELWSIKIKINIKIQIRKVKQNVFADFCFDLSQPVLLGCYSSPSFFEGLIAGFCLVVVSFGLAQCCAA